MKIECCDISLGFPIWLKAKVFECPKIEAHSTSV